MRVNYDGNSWGNSLPILYKKNMVYSKYYEGNSCSRATKVLCSVLVNQLAAMNRELLFIL